MTQSHSIALYKEQYVQHNFDRAALFELMATEFDGELVLYPGCYVHITPSLYFASMTYVDIDRRAPKFFADPAIRTYVEENKVYASVTRMTFHHADYRTGIAEADQSFDMLISQFAGFISKYCQRYVKPGGYLLVNNSHGDASLASLDVGWELAAVIHRRGSVYRLDSTNLEDYFVPRADKKVTKESVETMGRGVTYQKMADNYVFRRTAYPPSI